MNVPATIKRLESIIARLQNRKITTRDIEQYKNLQMATSLMKKLSERQSK